MEEGTQRHVPFNIAGIYAIRGKKKEALHWLQIAIDYKWIDYAMITHGPWFSSLQNDQDMLTLIQPVINKMDSLRLRIE